MNPKIKNFTVNIVVQHLRNKKFLISRPSKRQQKVTDSPISSVSNAETTDEKEKITDSDQKRADENTDEEIGLFLCPSCGAEIVTDATTASTWCYYCHNPVVLTERLSGKFLPEKILPFQIERKAAEDNF